MPSGHWLTCLLWYPYCILDMGWRSMFDVRCSITDNIMCNVHYEWIENVRTKNVWKKLNVNYCCKWVWFIALAHLEKLHFEIGLSRSKIFWWNHGKTYEIQKLKFQTKPKIFQWQNSNVCIKWTSFGHSYIEISICATVYDDMKPKINSNANSPT